MLNIPYLFIDKIVLDNIIVIETESERVIDTYNSSVKC